MHTPSVSIPTRRDMARVLVASGEFTTTDIDRALGLPDVTSAGFMAAMTRYGKQVLAKREGGNAAPVAVQALPNASAAASANGVRHVNAVDELRLRIQNPEIAYIFGRLRKRGDSFSMPRYRCPTNIPAIYSWGRRLGLKVSMRNTEDETTLSAV